MVGSESKMRMVEGGTGESLGCKGVVQEEEEEEEGENREEVADKGGEEGDQADATIVEAQITGSSSAQDL
jgi:hypothetical protein